MSINRSQDNFVVQWGDTAEEGQLRKSLGSAKTQLPAEFERPAAGLDFHALPDKDGWAPKVRSEEHKSELQSLTRNSYADLCMQKKNRIASRNHIDNKQKN